MNFNASPILTIARSFLEGGTYSHRSPSGEQTCRPHFVLKRIATLGCATPREVFEKINTLRKVVGCNIETHFHNDTGCAVANAYVALEAGATHIDTTVLGIGERNGITSLSGLVASLIPTHRKYILSKYKIEKLSYLEHLVAQIVKVEIPFNNFVVSLQKFDEHS